MAKVGIIIEFLTLFFDLYFFMNYELKIFCTFAPYFIYDLLNTYLL